MKFYQMKCAIWSLSLIGGLVFGMGPVWAMPAKAPSLWQSDVPRWSPVVLVDDDHENDEEEIERDRGPKKGKKGKKWKGRGNRGKGKRESW